MRPASARPRRTGRPRTRRGSSGASSAAAATRFPFAGTVLRWDATEMEPDPELRAKQARLQEIVAAVAGSMQGASVEDMAVALQVQAVAAGLQSPPQKWLDDVATQAAGGHVYVVSQAAIADTDVEVPELDLVQNTATKRDGGDQAD
jgi:hypothetical protein